MTLSSVLRLQALEPAGKKFLQKNLLESPPPMPFSAQYVIAHYAKFGKDSETLYAGIAAQDGVEFTEMRES